MKRTGECCKNLGHLLAASVFFVQHLLYHTKGRLGKNANAQAVPFCLNFTKSFGYRLNTGNWQNLLEYKRPNKMSVRALNSRRMVETSALNPYILENFSAEACADTVFTGIEQWHFFSPVLN